MLLLACFSIGLLLAILHWVGVIETAENAAAYQNFLITIEMFAAAMLLFFAFPYGYYRSLCKDSNGRGIPMQDISSHFRQTLNPHDVVNDAIHNFSKVYQQYAIQEDLSEQSDNEKNIKVSSSAMPSSGGLSLKGLNFGRKRTSGGGSFEKATLLVESDEDEIL